MTEERTITYHLPRSRLRISGVATTQRHLGNGEWVRSSSAEVELDIEADPDDYFVLDLNGSGFADSSFELSLTDDGRLTSASATATGRVGAAIKSVLSVAATITGAVGGLTKTPRGMGWRKPKAGGAITYEKDHPEMAARLEEAKRVAADLAKVVIDAAKRVGIDHASTPNRRAASSAMFDVLMALRQVRAEVALLEQHKAAWRAQSIAQTTESHSFVVLLNDAPPVATVHSWIEDKDELTKELLGDMWPVYESLQVIVALDSAQPPSYGAGSNANSRDLGSKHSGVMFRRPHPAAIVVFGHEPGSDDLVELSRSAELVMDGNSPVEFLPFDKAWLGEKTLALEFSTHGSPTKLSTRETSELAGAASVLGELPDTVKAALTRANEIIDQHQVLERQGIEQQLARIEDERKLVEAQIANDEALANQHLAGEMGRLQSQKLQLQAHKDIGNLRLDLEVAQQTGADQISKQVAALQKELEQLQLDRADIRRQLAESEAASRVAIEAAVARELKAMKLSEQ